MSLFELMDYEKVELSSCDHDIVESFKKIGGGYHTGLPTQIQMNRNIQKLNKLLKSLIDKSKNSEDCANNCKDAQNNIKPQ